MKKLLAMCAGITLAAAAIGIMLKKLDKGDSEVDYIDDDFDDFDEDADVGDEDWDAEGIDIDDEDLTQKPYSKEAIRAMRKVRAERRKLARKTSADTIKEMLYQIKTLNSGLRGDMAAYRDGIKCCTMIAQRKLKAISNDILPGDEDWRGDYFAWLHSQDDKVPTFNDLVEDLDPDGLGVDEDGLAYYNEGNDAENPFTRDDNADCNMKCESCVFYDGCKRRQGDKAEGEEDVPSDYYAEPAEEDTQTTNPLDSEQL